MFVLELLLNRLPPVVPPLLKLAFVEVKLKETWDIGRTAALLLAPTGPLTTAPELVTRWTPLTAMPTKFRTGRLVTKLVLHHHPLGKSFSDRSTYYITPPQYIPQEDA